MKPLLAHVYEPHRISYPCYVQPKLNGIRALYQAGCFQSRDGLPFPVGLLEHLAKPLLQVFSPEIILDGELYVHGWSLPRIAAAVTPVRKEPTEDTLKVEYHVFDVVYYTDAFWQRFSNQVAKGKFLGNYPIKFVDTERPASQAAADIAYATWVTLGYEGMMYRLGHCPYTVPKQERDRNKPPFFFRTKFLSDKDNRCWHLLKRKDWQDDEFPFLSIRATVGSKGEPGFIMTVASGVPSRPTFDLGSGLTDHEVESYLANPPHNRKIKVKYLCLSPYGIPLNPTILCVL